MSRKTAGLAVLVSAFLTLAVPATADTVRHELQPDGSVVTTTTESRMLRPGERGYRSPPTNNDLRKSGRHGCYKKRVTKRSESLSVFQWGITLDKRWCGYKNGRITSQDRKVYTSTGTNWKLVSKVSRTRMSSSKKGKTWAKAHFRLKYPNFEQNKYPEVGVVFNSSGHSKTWRS